jgi:hypothetical protein
MRASGDLPLRAQLVDPGRDDIGIEAQARPLAGTQALGPELRRMRVDPGAVDPPPVRDLGGGEVSWTGSLTGGQELGYAPSQGLDRARRQPELVPRRRVGHGAHRRALVDECPVDDPPVPEAAQWAMRAVATSM